MKSEGVFVDCVSADSDSASVSSTEVAPAHIESMCIHNSTHSLDPHLVNPAVGKKNPYLRQKKLF